MPTAFGGAQTCCLHLDFLPECSSLFVLVAIGTALWPVECAPYFAANAGAHVFPYAA